MRAIKGSYDGSDETVLAASAMTFSHGYGELAGVYGLT